MSHTSHREPCQHVHLSRNGVGDVSLCPDCGVVHVALQYMVLRFDRGAFEALAQLLGAAQQHIHQMRDGQPAEVEGRVLSIPGHPVKSALH